MFLSKSFKYLNCSIPDIFFSRCCKKEYRDEHIRKFAVEVALLFVVALLACFLQYCFAYLADFFHEFGQT